MYLELFDHSRLWPIRSTRGNMLIGIIQLALSSYMIKKTVTLTFASSSHLMIFLTAGFIFFVTSFGWMIIAISRRMSYNQHILIIENNLSVPLTGVFERYEEIKPKEFSIKPGDYLIIYRFRDYYLTTLHSLKLESSRNDLQGKYNSSGRIHTYVDLDI
ncbi:MAG: hypothetical protein GY754_21975 [bacterium]|nr:hypothetical protein [bacterium]